MTVFMLRAVHFRFGYRHEFVEVFSSTQLIEEYLKRYPTLRKVEITEHEVDPK